MSEQYISKLTFNPKASVRLEYGSDTYVGNIGFDDSIKNNGLIGFDFTLAEGKGASSCRIDVWDEDRALANILFKYVDDLGGLTPVVSNEAGEGIAGGGGSGSGNQCWLIPASGAVYSLHQDAPGGRTDHKGVDISSTGGTGRGGVVFATRDGEVIINAFEEGKAGWYVQLDHGDGYQTQYLHLHSQSPLKVGAKVVAGDPLGYEGSTGGSDGTHLHFSIIKDGKKINPGEIIPVLNEKDAQVKALDKYCVKGAGVDLDENGVNSDGTLNLSKDQSVNLLIQTALDEGVTDKAHIANILGQAQHESDNFRTSQEYDDGSAYEGRSNLGNTQAGDGKRFKGRGYIQITGRDNYKKFSKILGLDLISNPEIAEQPKVAALIAVIGMRDGVFTTRSLSDYGSDGNFDHVGARQIVNGNDRASYIAGLALDWYDKLDGLLDGKTAGEGTNISGLSNIGSGGGSGGSGSPNGGQITIDCFLDDSNNKTPRKVTYTFIHTGVDYSEDGRQVTIYGQSVAFKLAQKLINTSYQDVTLQQIFADFASRTNSDLEMADDGVLYDYFPINGTSAWKSLVEEAERRGLLVTAVNNKIKVQTLEEKKKEVEDDVIGDTQDSTEEVEEDTEGTDTPENTKDEPIDDFANTNKIYVIRNGYNSGLDVKFSHQAESHNGGGSSSTNPSNTTMDGEAKTEFDMLLGAIKETAEGALKGIDNPIYLEGTNIPALKPIYKDQEVVVEEDEADEETEEEDEEPTTTKPTKANTDKRDAVVEKYNTFVWITGSDDENSLGNPLWNVQIYVDGVLQETLRTVSGQVGTQDLDRNTRGNLSPSPDGEYRLQTFPGIPLPAGNPNPQLGGVWLPYFPKFPTNRSGLGFHVDPGWGGAKDGTAGCHAFRTLSEYNVLLDYVIKHKIDTLVIDRDGNPNFTGDVNKGDAQATDAQNRDAKNRIAGITLDTSLPVDEGLLLLSPSDMLVTQGFGVDKFRTRIKRNVKDVDYLDRFWIIQSISHSFGSGGYITSINAKSPFKSKLSL